MDDNYNKMAKLKPEREVQLDEVDNDKESLAEREDAYSDMSDMQTALSKLFPASLGDYISNKVMVGRISPDGFMDLLYLMTETDVFNTPEKENIDVSQMVLKNYILLSVGLDGKGRIDQIELAGAAKADEEMEKMSKLGL